MSNFTVSARKYRPGTFESVVGQQHVTQTLKNAIKKEHIPHALLFCGPRGVGKTTCARILAKALNCENRTAEGEPCGECNACRSFATQQAFNIFELDAASNNSVDDIRNLVEQVRFAPQTGKYKIYIIDEVHMLSTSAFNAFLKTLEEPPSYAIFILATTEKHKILPTILSRCQVFDFHRIGIKETIESLKEICKKEKIDAEEEALYVIAQKADGALRDALSIFDRIVSFSGEKITYKDVIENLNVLDYDYYFRFTDHFLNKELGPSLLLFNELQEKGFDPHHFLNGLSEHLRSLLVCKEPSTLTLLELPEGTQARYKEQAAKAPLSFILSGLSILNQFDVNYKASRNQRLHVELALMKMCYLQDVLHLTANGSAAEEEKKKPVSSPVRPEPAVASHAAAAPAQAPSKSNVAVVIEKEKPKPSFRLSEIRKNVTETRSSENGREAIVEDRQENNSLVITEEKLAAAWEGYTGQLRQRNKVSMATAAPLVRPELKAEGIVVRLPNDALKTQFSEDKLQLMEFLNRNYGIRGIQIEYIFEAPSLEQVRRYDVSDSGIFRRMAEINPAIVDMKEKLGLVVN